MHAHTHTQTLPRFTTPCKHLENNIESSCGFPSLFASCTYGIYFYKTAEILTRCAAYSVALCTTEALHQIHATSFHSSFSSMLFWSCYTPSPPLFPLIRGSAAGPTPCCRRCPMTGTLPLSVAKTLGCTHTHTHTHTHVSSSSCPHLQLQPPPPSSSAARAIIVIIITITTIMTNVKLATICLVLSPPHFFPKKWRVVCQEWKDNCSFYYSAVAANRSRSCVDGFGWTRLLSYNSVLYICCRCLMTWLKPPVRCHWYNGFLFLWPLQMFLISSLSLRMEVGLPTMSLATGPVGAVNIPTYTTRLLKSIVNLVSCIDGK